MKRIEGDLITDDDIVFDEDVVVTGKLQAKSIITKWALKVGGCLEVGEYVNNKYEMLDMGKIKTSRIRFTHSYKCERRFWLMILEPLNNIEELRAVITENNCWNDILDEALKVKDILLSYQFPTIINQALTVMLKE